MQKSKTDKEADGSEADVELLVLRGEESNDLDAGGEVAGWKRKQAVCHYHLQTLEGQANQGFSVWLGWWMSG